ncbi:MAG: DUF1080 domain-containing protein [Candidatus Marinimicrobia bacterium]|jgi:HEAT repeat protein|nr:DUF1080 domain-containing protein [Candidatus Neomarinimicrobiota bacterium]MBT3840172.1 DUF1080 domain-containing protein [Candidatus Neomarinimicrobiota bacterium]MBT4957865.1 DUF1080 domain-containing protein [Candidatus Neomarinimicrobiota bacterium]MBT5460044.1 DUF1080 domain-containing protein [Candidatus Neomarinimicrobiota bacterium]MBT6633335.1 DUF1080 domain-containing protein [Candidatus Neomarinimicrobiota bacterium]
MLKKLSLIAILIPGFVYSSQLPDESIHNNNLFNGLNLEGWEVHGTENWYVEMGELVCESGPDHEYGYLSTIKQYKDFDLSLLFKQESDGNSGVFFRSTFEGTKVTGWQVEVAPKGKDTGGIYESYGRGWLEKIPESKESVLAQGSWNKLRIKVIGDRVQTWLNGIKMVDMNDPKIGKGVGSIALQIHSGDNVRVRWRDIQLTEFVNVASSIIDFHSLSDPEQIQLLSSLHPYANEPNVKKVILSSINNKNQNIRLVALDLAGQIPDPKVVKILASHAAKSNGEEKIVAQNSLYNLNGSKIDSAIQSGLSNRNSDIKVEFIRAVGERRINNSIKTILKLATNKNGNVRLEAVKTLKVIASKPYLEDCIQLLVSAKTDSERTELEGTINGLMMTSSSKIDIKLMVDALKKTKEQKARLSFIRILGKHKDSETLKTLTTLLNDPSSDVQIAAIIALSGWNDDQPLSSIMDILASSNDPDQRILAAEGAVKLIGVELYRPVDEAIKLYGKVFSSCQNENETKAALRGLHGIKTIEAFYTAEDFLKDNALIEHAEAACLAIANNIQSLYPNECGAVIENIITDSSNDQHSQLAQAVLNNIQKLEDYITEWVMSEPFMISGQSMYATEFAPEKDRDAYSLWRKVPAFSDPNNYWHVDLTGLKTSLVAVVYLKTKVWSEIDQTVRLEMGSNDGIKAWMNDDMVHLHSVARGVTPGDDVVEAQLNKGWNTLLLKIINEGGGGWGACARLRRIDGGHLANVKYER